MRKSSHCFENICCNSAHLRHLKVFRFDDQVFNFAKIIYQNRASLLSAKKILDLHIGKYWTLTFVQHGLFSGSVVNCLVKCHHPLFFLLGSPQCHSEMVLSNCSTMAEVNIKLAFSNASYISSFWIMLRVLLATWGFWNLSAHSQLWTGLFLSGTVRRTARRQQPSTELGLHHIMEGLTMQWNRWTQNGLLPLTKVVEAALGPSDCSRENPKGIFKGKKGTLDLKVRKQVAIQRD